MPKRPVFPPRTSHYTPFLNNNAPTGYTGACWTPYKQTNPVFTNHAPPHQQHHTYCVPQFIFYDAVNDSCWHVFHTYVLLESPHQPSPRFLLSRQPNVSVAHQTIISKAKLYSFSVSSLLSPLPPKPRLVSHLSSNRTLFLSRPIYRHGITLRSKK